MDFRLDISMMLAMHDALRRELVQVGRIAARRDDNPGKLLHAALGWELFKKFLLVHEETDGLPLIDASLTPAEWQHFAQVHTERIRGDAPMYMPWLLNGASPQMLDAILSKFSPPLLTAFHEQWGPRYAALDIWPAGGESGE
jgi:hypothetical protein